MFIRLTKTLGILTLAAAAAACSAAGSDSSEEVEGAFDPISLPQHEIDQVVQLVNSPATTAAVLDFDIGLDSRAAENIIAHRAGSDGVYPSGDDDRFTSLEELDSVPFVGASALRKLRDWAVAHPPAQPELVDGVQFSAEQAVAVVWGINHASVSELDLEVGLTSTAAKNLVAGAPYETVTEIGAVEGVGPAALGVLRNRATAWAVEMGQGSAPAQAGTYDGIAFDENTADKALSIANTATYAQLTGEGGMYSGGATTIVEGRPFSSLAALSETYGIGPASMRALHDYAASGKFAAPKSHE